MTNAYESWVDQAVILQVVSGDLRVPLRGVVVGESDAALRFRVGDGLDIDIYKSMVLSVEVDQWASLSMDWTVPESNFIGVEEVSTTH